MSIAAAVMFWLRLPGIRQIVRPIYTRKGIIPEVATGLTTANILEED
jgi:hypothetical protein